MKRVRYNVNTETYTCTECEFSDIEREWSYCPICGDKKD
jgi:rubrerythrin